MRFVVDNLTVGHVPAEYFGFPLMKLTIDNYDENDQVRIVNSPQVVSK
jgi:hypothetical protein